ELEDESDMLAAISREFRLARLAQVAAGKPHRAARGHVEPPEDVEQGGLAAAGGAQQDDELAPVDIEVHVTKRVHLDFPGPVGLAEAAHLEHRRLGLARSWIGGHRIEGTTFRSGRAARRNRCSGWP